MRSVAVALALAVMSVALHASSAGAAPPVGQPQLFLSWHAPYGEPGASDALVTACDDTMRADTLYLSFSVPRTNLGVTAMSGVVYFHPMPGDTLGDFWFFKRGWANEGNMLVDFDYAAGFPCELPWHMIGKGQVYYDHRSGRGRLDLSFTVPLDWLGAIYGNKRYCFARVSIRQRRPDLLGCMQPVCVEWAGARIEWAGGKRVTELSHGASRFVTWNSKSGQACAPRRASSPVQPWQPKLKPPPTPPGK